MFIGWWCNVYFYFYWFKVSDIIGSLVNSYEMVGVCKYFVNGICLCLFLFYLFYL